MITNNEYLALKLIIDSKEHKKTTITNSWVKLPYMEDISNISLLGGLLWNIYKELDRKSLIILQGYNIISPIDYNVQITTIGMRRVNEYLDSMAFLD